MGMQMQMPAYVREDEAHTRLLDVASLYRRHIVMVRRRAERLLGGELDAPQVAEEAFIKLVEHRDWQGTQEELAMFLYRTVTNLALNRLRESQRRRELSALRSRNKQKKAAPDALAVLRDILAQVSYDEAQVAAYYYVDGLEPEEIGDLLQIEPRTVQRRLACFDERAPRLLPMTRMRYVA